MGLCRLLLQPIAFAHRSIPLASVELLRSFQIAMPNFSIMMSLDKNNYCSSYVAGRRRIVLLTEPVFQTRTILKVKADLSGQRSRSDIVGSTKSREEIVECGLVRYVYDCEACTPAVAVAMEKIVIAERDIKQVAWSNAWRIVVVVFSAGLRNRNVFRTVL
jgi:hypothetical protein